VEGQILDEHGNFQAIKVYSLHFAKILDLKKSLTFKKFVRAVCI